MDISFFSSSLKPKIFPWIRNSYFGVVDLANKTGDFELMSSLFPICKQTSRLNDINAGLELIVWLEAMDFKIRKLDSELHKRNTAKWLLNTWTTSYREESRRTLKPHAHSFGDHRVFRRLIKTTDFVVIIRLNRNRFGTMKTDTWDRRSIAWEMLMNPLWAEKQTSKWRKVDFGRRRNGYERDGCVFENSTCV